MTCRICELVKTPDMKIYYKDKNILIIGEPNKGRYDERLLCIWKNHSKTITPSNLSELMSKCWLIKENLNGVWDIIVSLRTHPQHFHIHIGRFK